MSWLRAENFGNLEQHLKAQKLKTFLELSGKVYLDLVKVFYANLKFSNGILKTSVKGVEMEITKIGNIQLVEGDQGVNIEVGANDHETGTNGGNQDEDEPQPMAIELYNPLENAGPAYSQFERMILNQLQDLNMAQNAHHAYCTIRFQDLDGQLHNVHDVLSNVNNRDNSRNE